MRRFAIILAVSSGLVSMPAQAADPLVLEPSSGWALLNDGQRCKLVRNFGTGKELVQLELRSFNPDSRMQLVAAGNPLKFRRMKVRNAYDIRFLPEDNERPAHVGHGELPDDTPVISSSVSISRLAVDVTMEEALAAEEARIAEGRTISLNSPDEAREQEITGLLIDGPYTRPVILNTGEMAAPMGIMRRCVDKLLADFGVDMEAHEAYLRNPEPVESPGKWFVEMGGFPGPMQRKSRFASVSFRVLVDDTGKPVKCDVLDSGQSQEFSELVCKTMMEKAAFEPALDADGKPMQSIFTSVVQFVL